MAHKARVSHKGRVDHYAASLGARGRVVLPAPLRRRLALSEGDQLLLTVEEGSGSARLSRLDDQIRKARGLFAHLAPGRSLVDELIAERREEALREDED
jgi:AbrB family looped-hinge helix DNA binding protein